MLILNVLYIRYVRNLRLCFTESIAILRRVLPIWFAAGCFRSGGYGRIVIPICTLIGKYFDYSHVTSQSRGTGGFSPEILPIVIVIE